MVTITSLSRDDRSARMVLAVALEPDDPVTGRLLATEGAVETVRLALASGGMPRRVDPVAAELWRSRVAPRMDARAVEQAVVGTERLGLRVLVPSDRDWPTGLNDLGDHAPTALWTRGATSFLEAPLRDRVTVTGVRAATGYGEHVACELASDLANAERIIVTGGSYGIDAAAHRAALTVGGQTIAVLAAGLDRLYPMGNNDLLERTGDVGLLVSEMPPGSVPTRSRFLARNRVLGAISGVTVIVEAGHRSGALNVAARAAQLGRLIGAVPGPVTSAASAGTHRLLRENVASLVTDSRDVVSLLGSPSVGERPTPTREDRIVRMTGRLGPAL